MVRQVNGNLGPSQDVGIFNDHTNNLDGPLQSIRSKKGSDINRSVLQSGYLDIKLLPNRDTSASLAEGRDSIRKPAVAVIKNPYVRELPLDKMHTQNKDFVNALRETDSDDIENENTNGLFDALHAANELQNGAPEATYHDRYQSDKNDINKLRGTMALFARVGLEDQFRFSGALRGLGVDVNAFWQAIRDDDTVPTINVQDKNDAAENLLLVACKKLGINAESLSKDERSALKEAVRRAVQLKNMLANPNPAGDDLRLATRGAHAPILVAHTDEDGRVTSYTLYHSSYPLQFGAGEHGELIDLETTKWDLDKIEKNVKDLTRALVIAECDGKYSSLDSEEMRTSILRNVVDVNALDPQEQWKVALNNLDDFDFDPFEGNDWSAADPVLQAIHGNLTGDEDETCEEDLRNLCRLMANDADVGVRGALLKACDKALIEPATLLDIVQSEVLTVRPDLSDTKELENFVKKLCTKIWKKVGYDKKFGNNTSDANVAQQNKLKKAIRRAMVFGNIIDNYNGRAPLAPCCLEYAAGVLVEKPILYANTRGNRVTSYTLYLTDGTSPQQFDADSDGAIIDGEDASITNWAEELKDAWNVVNVKGGCSSLQQAVQSGFGTAGSSAEEVRANMLKNVPEVSDDTIDEIDEVNDESDASSLVDDYSWAWADDIDPFTVFPSFENSWNGDKYDIDSMLPAIHDFYAKALGEEPIGDLDWNMRHLPGLMARELKKDYTEACDDIGVDAEEFFESVLDRIEEARDNGVNLSDSENLKTFVNELCWQIWNEFDLDEGYGAFKASSNDQIKRNIQEAIRMAIIVENITNNRITQEPLQPACLAYANRVLKKPVVLANTSTKTGKVTSYTLYPYSAFDSERAGIGDAIEFTADENGALEEGEYWEEELGNAIKLVNIGGRYNNLEELRLSVE